MPELAPHLQLAACRVRARSRAAGVGAVLEVVAGVTAGADEPLLDLGQDDRVDLPLRDQQAGIDGPGGMFCSIRVTRGPVVRSSKLTRAPGRT